MNPIADLHMVYIAIWLCLQIRQKDLVSEQTTVSFFNAKMRGKFSEQTSDFQGQFLSKLPEHASNLKKSLEKFKLTEVISENPPIRVFYNYTLLVQSHTILICVCSQIKQRHAYETCGVMSWQT